MTAHLSEPSAWLTRYTRVETAFDKILPSGRLLMNPYARMRDPLENRRPFFNSAGAWGDDRDWQNRTGAASSSATDGSPRRRPATRSRQSSPS